MLLGAKDRPFMSELLWKLLKLTHKHAENHHPWLPQHPPSPWQAPSLASTSETYSCDGEFCFDDAGAKLWQLMFAVYFSPLSHELVGATAHGKRRACQATIGICSSWNKNLGQKIYKCCAESFPYWQVGPLGKWQPDSWEDAYSWLMDIMVQLTFHSGTLLPDEEIQQADVEGSGDWCHVFLRMRASSDAVMSHAYNIMNIMMSCVKWVRPTRVPEWRRLPLFQVFPRTRTPKPWSKEV